MLLLALAFTLAGTAAEEKRYMECMGVCADVC